MNSNDIQLSKSLSWLLRHGAVKEGFDLSPEGYINVNKILQHKNFKSYQLSDIERVVRNNEKQRFQLRRTDTGSVEIKANQGHSIEITDAELTPILRPKYHTVVHGTYVKFWPQIKESGLSRMTRRHIHLAKSTGTDNTVISGIRNNAQIHILVNLTKALEDGIKFYESDNGVILTPGNESGFLETKYFDRVVEVTTGYPPYTRAQDLAHAFSQFGSVRLDHEWVTESAACLQFADAAQARAAMRASRAVNVYGAFLTVGPCSLGARPQRARGRREPRVLHGNDHKGSIIEPSKIPLQGVFLQQLEALLSAVRLTPPEMERLAALYRDLEYVLHDVWPGCRAIPFGSVTTGLGVKSSDADCFVSLPNGAARNGAVFRAKRALQAHPHVFDQLLAIPRANTPIVKFLHIPTGVYCDLSFKTALGSQNSKLISFLLFSDPRLIPVAVVIKYWARVHELTGTGKLTNYALTMLIIFFFQQSPYSILPPVEWLQRDRSFDCYVDYWNTGFMTDLRRIPRSTNTSSTVELLGGFFEYYANFDFEQYCVCPFLGRTVKKDDFRDLRLLPEEFARYKTNVYSGATLPMRFMTSMCVQDPFEQCHNVASAVSSRLAADIRAYFKFASDAYEKEKLKDFTGFLKTILLEKPELPRTKKGGSEFRARLPAGLLGNLAAADWRAAVREVAFQLFETILRVKLTKIEEPEEVENDVKAAKANKTEFAKRGKGSKTEEIAPDPSKPGKMPKAEDSILAGKIAKSEGSPKPRRKSVDTGKLENTTKSEDIPKPGNDTVTSEEVTKSMKHTVKEDSGVEERASPEKGKLKVEVTKGGKVMKPGGITRKEKEKYMGEITKAIWKRKLFSKLYSVMGLKLLDRETMITDEIMKVDKNVFDVKFHVMFTFNNAQRSAVVSIRHVSGELNSFKEFGKFFNNTFQQWFVVLYRPYCKKNKNPVADQKSVPSVTDEEAAAKELNEAMKEDVEDQSDSDSDTDFSYEDERIDPNAESSEVFEREDSSKHDADKKDKIKSNSAVKKQGESDKTKKCDTNEIDNKVTLSEQKHDKELASDESPRKGKNKQHNDKNKDSLVDHINDGIESLNLSEKSPQRSKNCDKNRRADIGDQNEEYLNATDKSKNSNKTLHGDNKREIDKSKTKQRNRKLKDKSQSSTAETGDKTSAGENGQMPQ